jgi:surfeit locus 1 family protein
VTHGRAKRHLLLALCCLGLVLFTGLGIWQVERLGWKLDLIARVEERVHEPVKPAPTADAWPAFNAKDAEYRHVEATGVFLHDRETLVEALTERGAGYWVVTPLKSASGTILINRGFVPPERANPQSRAAGQLPGPVTITGLLRPSEPEGRFLRSNRPGEDRWYSRDVSAIAATRGLDRVAPFFIDADAAPNPEGLPIGGLTIVHFRNAHLVYALTWFGLAALSLLGLVLLRKPEQEPR